MAAIASNGTGGGNWNTGASWAGGVVPTVADTVTIAAGDTITVDTTGLGALTLTLNGIITWTAGATTGLQLGNGTSDTIVTFGATGYWRAGTVATPLTGLHTVTFHPLSTSLASVFNNFNMAACNTVTSGMTVVCDRTVYGVAETYTHPITAVAYATRRNFTLVSTQINVSQALAVLSEDLKLRAGGGDIVTFPSSTAANGLPNVAQIRTTASYNSGTRTLTATSNFTTQVTLNTLAGAPTLGARCYSEASVFTMTANVNTKYWGFTGSASANALFELQNATIKWCTGNSNTFVQFNGRAIQGCVLIGTAAAVTGTGFRHSTVGIQFISCVLDAFPNQNFGPQFYYNCFWVAVVRQSFDYINVMAATDFYDCHFQDCVQAPVNSTGCAFVRCTALQCSSAAGSCGIVTDCVFHRLNVLAWSGTMIRPIFGAMTTLGNSNVYSMFVESPTFLGTIGTLGAEVNTRTSSNRTGFIFGLQGGSGAFAPSTIGLKSAPGGNTTAFSTPPDAIATPPSKAVIYNRLVTTAAIAPTFAGEPFRPAMTNYQFNAVSGTTYSFTVPILSVSGYTPTSLTAIRLVLTWADGTSVTTTVSSLTANVWNLTNVAGVCPASGICNVRMYVQANIGSVYIDYPLDCDPAGYRWTSGLPQVSQTRLQDSSAGTVALAVWASVPGTSGSGTRGALQDGLLQESIYFEDKPR
jgi:hypothetical protein